MSNLRTPHLFIVRPAASSEAYTIAKLAFLSMGNELAEYLFGGTRLPIETILAGLFSFAGNRFSQEVTEAAELEGQLAGMLSSFPGWQFQRRELGIGLGLLRLCGLWDVLRLARRALAVADGIETRRDEYYLANLAVFPAFQKRGIGSALLEHAENKARQAGLKKCSLIVDLENPTARRLYERFGYRVVMTKTYPGAAGEAHTGYHRMVKELL